MLVRPPHEAVDPRRGRQRMALVDHLSVIVVAGQEVGVTFHPVLRPPRGRLAHGKEEGVGHDRAGLWEYTMRIGEVVHGIARVDHRPYAAPEHVQTPGRGEKPL